MVIAVALNIPQIFLKSFRWRYLLNSQGIKYGIWQVTLAYFGSIFIGLLTPGRLGEFARAVYISSDCNVSTGGSFASVLADRLFDLYVLVAIGGTALISVTALNTQQSWAGMVLLTGGLTLALVLPVTDRGFALMQAFGSSLGQIGKRLFAPGNWLLEMRTGFRQLSWPTILISAGLTVIAYAVFFGQCYLLALALRLPVTFASVGCAVALGSLVTLLPISMSGIGTRDAAIIAYLGTVGILSEMALAFSLNELRNEWYVLYRGDTHFSDWDPRLREQLLSIEKVLQDTPLLTIDQSLVGNVGASEGLTTAEWGIERASGQAFLWLGHGDQQGVKGTLWSAEKQLVGLAFDVLSGPAREDSQRTVELTLENEAGIKTERRQFDQATTLTFGVELQPGRNEFSFKSLDRATVLTQPNGDIRPLLVLLRWITVTPLLAASQAGPANYPLLTVDPSLTGAVGIDPYIKTPWPIEVYEEQSLSFLWIGHGDAEGVAGVLWSDAAREVVLEFEVSPGPSREDQQRTVQLVSQNNGQVTTQRETFDGPVVLVFSVQLQPGRNDFQFTVLDEATITVHGDPRPLLVFLRQITVRSLS